MNLHQPWGKLAIGLTGGIGCGKSTVAELFVARGVSLIDTDHIAHALTAPNGHAMPAIRAAFGDGYALANGALDRAAMRKLVFNNPDAKLRLESILHPMIGEECKRQALEASGAYLLFAIPLLFESGHWQQKVNRVLVIDCPLEIQIARVMQRSQISADEVKAIIAHQISREQRLKLADDIIDNSGQPAALASQVEQLHQRYMTSI